MTVEGGSGGEPLSHRQRRVPGQAALSTVEQGGLAYADKCLELLRASGHRDPFVDRELAANRYAVIRC